MIESAAGVQSRRVNSNGANDLRAPAHAGLPFDSRAGMHISSHRAFRAALFVLLLIPLVSPQASAQSVPDAGQFAAGADIGIFLPADDRLDASLTGGGFVETYLTPRVGVRGSVMTAAPGYARNSDEREQQIRIGADVIYNWEHGRIHPFAGGGLGVYVLRYYNGDENVGPNETNLGAAALGGLEYFLNRAWTLKTEGRYQWVTDRPLLDPDGFALTFGVKRYF
jgi:opacity protein-like surface antigen